MPALPTLLHQRCAPATTLELKGCCYSHRCSNMPAGMGCAARAWTGSYYLQGCAGRGGTYQWRTPDSIGAAWRRLRWTLPWRVALTSSPWRADWRESYLRWAGAGGSAGLLPPHLPLHALPTTAQNFSISRLWMRWRERRRAHRLPLR